MRDAEPPSTFVLPEFTRSLRGFASPRALGTSDHERVFAPLLAARKAAARVETVEGQLAAFDPQRLHRALHEAIDAISAERFRREGADRRALAAGLEELAAPVFEALRALERAAASVRVAADADRPDFWRAWVREVQAVFNGTDRFWVEFQLSVGSAPERGSRSAGARKGFLRLSGAVLLGAAMSAGGLGAQHVSIRVTGVRAESLLARGFDVVGREPGAVIVVADPAERARMERFGWRGAALAAPSLLRQPSADLQVAAAPRVYRSYDDPSRGVLRFIDSLAQNNPRVTVDTLGRSFEGRPMLAVKVGPKGDSPARPNLLFLATYHAREWAATEMALRLITYLANPPAGNARIDSLLQSRDIWIVPVANPDGYQYTFTNDRLWRKTRSPQAAGAIGVDMNRNHRERWGLDNAGSSGEPSSEIYRGPSAASEVEVRNIEAFHAAHPPVLSVSYHSYAGLLLYPPGAVYGERPADLPVYLTLAGTNLRSAALDHVPGSSRSFSSPSSAWMLYVTNGEYTDWAATKHGALSFTAELSSGYTSGSYYGFQFPDDEPSLRQLFEDNLPFALDLIESARDPFGFVSPTTVSRTPRVVLESISPDVRVTIPAAAASGATIAAPTPLSFRIDSASGGRYTRRLIASGSARPQRVTVSALGQATSFTLLEINGAERTDAAWKATGFRLDSTLVLAGKYSWSTAGSGELRSTVVRVPTDADTVSLVFWTRYDGNGFQETPNGQVRVSTDGGSSFQTVLRVQGFAPAWYPERVTLGGVKGRQLVFAFVPTALQWSLDEIAVVAHGAVTSTSAGATLALRPSENPVRRGVVYFSWPFSRPDGDMRAYDFTGRQVWQSPVTNGVAPPWDLAAARLPNGVYVVAARSAGQTVRMKLYVVRNGT